MNKNKAVIITGASGFIGSKLTDLFIKKSYIVYAYDLVNKLNENENIIYIKYDLNGYIEEAPFKEADTIIHCAYIKDSSDKQAFTKNIEGSKKIINLSRKYNINIVFLTSMSAHIDAESNYGKSKYIIENYLDINKDLIIRPGLVIGEGGGLYGSMQEIIYKFKIIPLIRNKKNIIQYVDLKQLCNFIYYSLENNIKGKYTIASYKSITMKELYTFIAKKNKRKIFFITVPYFLINLLLKFFEILNINFGISRENLKGLKKIKYFKPDTFNDFGKFYDIEKIL